MHYIISYDITSNRSRKKISDILENYGTRIQFSVFYCQMPVKHLALLKKELSPFVKGKTDSVMFFRMCESCYPFKESLGYELKITAGKVDVV